MTPESNPPLSSFLPMFPSVTIRVSSVAAALFLLGAAALGQGYSPAEAPGKMKLPEGFSVKLVASEPLIRQPGAIVGDAVLAVSQPGRPGTGEGGSLLPDKVRQSARPAAEGAQGGRPADD